jgi:hypothetical protein
MRGQTDLSQRPRTDAWITYSQRAKSPSKIKSNFETWTRLGLFTISTPTRHLSVAVAARGPKVEYEPALLDTQQSDNFGQAPARNFSRDASLSAGGPIAIGLRR